MEPMVPSDSVVTLKMKSHRETLEANVMMSTLNWVVMPHTKNLIGAHCTDLGVGARLMWSVPMRLDQTQHSDAGRA